MSDGAPASRPLRVFRGNRPVGTLERTEAGARFSYAPGFLAERPTARDGVAFAMPPRPEPSLVAGANLHPFFTNLLPEGLRLAALATRIRATMDDFYAQFAAIAPDVVGDVWASDGREPTDDPIELGPETRFSDLLQRYLVEAIEPSHLAVAGVQNKLSGVRFTFAARRAGQPVIVKLGGVFPGLPENEAFFLGVAADLGFEVPRHAVVHDADGESALVVERFDRHEGRRIHVEDALQLLDLYPADKYAPSFRRVVEAIAAVADAPVVASQEIIVRYAFAYLIGNADLHAKNLSVWVSPKSGLVEPSPVYDVLCTEFYPGIVTNMALKLDGRDAKLRREDFLAFGERFRVPRRSLGAKLDELVGRLRPHIHRIGALPFDARNLERWANRTEDRCRRLLDSTN